MGLFSPDRKKPKTLKQKVAALRKKAAKKKEKNSLLSEKKKLETFLRKGIE